MTCGAPMYLGDPVCNGGIIVANTEKEDGWGGLNRAGK